MTAVSSGAHLVQDALLLLPVGTTNHGTSKQYVIGKVHASYGAILTHAAETGNDAGLLAKAESA